MGKDVYERGLGIRKSVLGSAYVDKALAAADDFTGDFQELITRYAWGEIWSRPGLDRLTRRCVTLAMLAALHCDDELAMHVRAALSDGMTAEELKEVLLQVAIYAGVPAGVDAFRNAREALQEIGA